MCDSVDVFRVDTRGLRWLESAASIESAKARVEELSLASPGEYLALDQRTGNKYAIKPDGIEELPR